MWVIGLAVQHILMFECTNMQKCCTATEPMYSNANMSQSSKVNNN